MPDIVQHNIRTIADIVGDYDPSAMDKETLIEALVAREDAMADVLRMAGTQFGLFPQIVAKVLVDMRLGSPVDDDTKAMLDRQFTDLMERIAAYHRGEGEFPQP